MNTLGIEDIACYLPEQIVTNDDLKGRYAGFNVRRAELATGIKARRLESNAVPLSDMAVRAADKLFAQGRVQREEIDFIVTVTQTGDYRLPATACVIQDKLGLPTSIGALDINLGCSGYVYGLAVAQSLVHMGLSKKALLITADKPLLVIHESDYALRFLHGDAAAATVVSNENPLAIIGRYDMGTDGSGARALYVPAKGTAMPEPIPTDEIPHPECAQMDGLAIFDFSTRVAPISIRSAIEKNGLTVGDIAWFILHQANRMIVDGIREKLGVPEEKVPTNLAEVGNTTSASIPLILDDILRGGKAAAGEKIVISGFGVGLSWASTVLTTG